MLVDETGEWTRLVIGDGNTGGRLCIWEYTKLLLFYEADEVPQFAGD